MSNTTTKTKEKPQAAFMTPRELAEYIGFNRRTIYQKIVSHQIPAIRIFGSWRFRKSDVDKWIRDHCNTKPPKRRKDGSKKENSSRR